MSIISKVINVTLDEEKELYNSDNETLKELALKAFTEKELKVPHYSEIKTFEDAVKAVGMNLDFESDVIADIEITSKAMAAMYKLNIVRKALNYWNDLHLAKDPEGSYIYYPYNPFVTKSSTYYESDINSGNMEIVGRINVEGEKYNILCGSASYGGYAGLGCFDSYDGVGNAFATVVFLGCANEKIAKHFGKYFGMLITEAKFGDLDGFEIIEDKYGCVE